MGDDEDSSYGDGDGDGDGDSDGGKGIKIEDGGATIGAGRGKRSKNQGKKTKDSPDKATVLKEGDENYPKDIPEGSPHYQKFWIAEVRDVIDQGRRRTCWTIASTTSLAARLVIERKADPPILLSALHLLIGLYPKTDDKGGLKKLSDLQKFLTRKGAVLEEECTCVDPFSLSKSKGKGKGKGIAKKEAPPLCTDKREPKRIFKVQDLVISETVDEKELIRLVDQGPVAVTIDVYQEFETFRGKGIYPGPTRDSKWLDKHMLVVTGYGTYKNQHYWKCQNSAGLKFGDKGKIKILRQVSREEGQPSLFNGILYPVLLDRRAYN